MSFTVPSSVKPLPPVLPSAFLPGIPAQPSADRAVEQTPSLRLVPAVVSGARVFVECPSWCTVDHTEDPNAPLEDVWHSSDYADLQAPHMGSEDDLIAWARLGLDPASSNPGHRKPFIVIDQGDEGSYMSPDHADRFASNLEAFAAHVRAMARIARGGAQ